MKKFFHYISVSLLVSALSISVLIKDIYSQWVHSSNGIYSEKINSLASDADRIYACTGNFGLFCTTNNGNTWQSINNGIQDSSVNAFIRYGGKIFSATNNHGIYASTNNGLNWFASNTGLINLSVKCLASNSTNIFAGTNGSGIFTSTNGGINWIQINSGLTSNEIKAFFIDGNNIYAGTGFGVYLSTNNGNSWTLINNGIPSYTTITDFEKEGTSIYAATYTGIGIYKTTNGGSNWHTCNNGLPMNHHINNIALIDSVLFAATDNGIYTSSNSGNQWTKNDEGLFYPDITFILKHGSGIFAGTGRGIFLSQDSGINWAPINNGFPNDLIIPSIFNTGNTIFCGTYGNGIFKSNDNGINWFPSSAGLEGFDVEAFILKGNKIFIGTDDGVYVSSNSGQSWKNLFRLKLIYSLAVKDSCIFAGICSCSGGGILKSTDDGESWFYANEGLDFPNVLAMAVCGDRVFCGCNDGLFITTNLGNNWVRVNAGLPEFYGVTSIDVSGNNMIIGTFSDGVFLSSNCGNYWEPAGTGLPSGLRINSVTFSGNNLLLSSPLGIFVKNAGSNNWVSANTGLPYSDISGLKIIGNQVFAGSGLMLSTGIWRRPLSEMTTGIINGTAELPKSVRLQIIYPNPSNPSVQIIYELSKPGFAKINIFDILGREVSRLVSEYKSAGSHIYEFSGGNLPSGIYFVRLEFENYSDAKKLMIVK